MVIRVLGDTSRVHARHGRYGSHEVSADGLKLLRKLGPTWLVGNRLLGALVGLADVARGQWVSEIDSLLGDVPRVLDGVLIRMSQVLVSDVRPLPPPWELPASSV